MMQAGGKDDCGVAYYYRSVNGLIPLRWTSIETFQSLVSTVKSDVWSFGVLMTEVFTDGDVPYVHVTTVSSPNSTKFKASPLFKDCECAR